MQGSLYASMENYTNIIRADNAFYLVFLGDKKGSLSAVTNIQRLAPAQIASLLTKGEYVREKDQPMKVPDRWKDLEEPDLGIDQKPFLAMLDKIKAGT